MNAKKRKCLFFVQGAAGRTVKPPGYPNACDLYIGAASRTLRCDHDGVLNHPLS